MVLKAWYMTAMIMLRRSLQWLLFLPTHTKETVWFFSLCPKHSSTVSVINSMYQAKNQWITAIIFQEWLLKVIITEVLKELSQPPREVNRNISTNFNRFRRRPYFCQSTYLSIFTFLFSADVKNFFFTSKVNTRWIDLVLRLPNCESFGNSMPSSPWHIWRMYLEYILNI